MSVAILCLIGSFILYYKPDTFRVFNSEYEELCPYTLTNIAYFIVLEMILILNLVK